MPFMKGTAPIRRTKSFLEAGKLIFRPEIRVMTVNFNVDQESSRGAYEFMFWHLPQIKYKNRHLQILKFKNMTPTPFFQFFFINGERVLVDVYGRDRFEIHEHLRDTFCNAEESKKEIIRNKALVKNQLVRINPANFGYHCNKWCICEFPGQVPCPGYVPLPNHMRGKYKGKSTEESEQS